MKHLSPDEQRVLHMARRHRAEYLRRRKRIKPFGKDTKLTLFAAVCAIGLLAGNAPSARAAETPMRTSAPELFNKANADQRAGYFGPAILGYERAHLLAPRDTAIAQNLQAAREKAGVSTPAIPAWRKPAHWLNFNALALLASFSSLLLLGLIAFGTRFVPAAMRCLSRRLAMSFGAIAVFAASAIGVRWPELNRAVVTGSNAVTHIAPADNAASSFTLKPGELVRAEKSYGEFTLVRTGDGRSGWVSSTEVERVIPNESHTRG